MDISLVNNHYQLGGAETVVRQLHEGALAHGHASHLYVSDGKTWPRAPGLHPLYPRWLARLQQSRFRRWAERLAPFRRTTDRAFRRLATRPTDIVHVHSFHAHYATLESFAAVARAKPFVWTFHRFWGITGGCDHPFTCQRYQTGCGECPLVGQFPVGPRDRTAEEWRAKQAMLSPLPLHIISPSHHLARRVRDSVLGQNWITHVIPNGVDCTAFSGARKRDPDFRQSLGLHPTKTVVLVTNREFLDPIKGFPVIAAAFGTQSHWPDLQLVLVGGNTVAARAQLPAALDVVDIGYLRDRRRLAALHEAADLYLYASDGENFPCAIIEAMASACVIVATPVDGVTEQISAPESGVLASANSGLALAAALRTALDFSPAARDGIGAHARDLALTSFSEQQMINAHFELYRELIAAGPIDRT